MPFFYSFFFFFLVCTYYVDRLTTKERKKERERERELRFEFGGFDQDGRWRRGSWIVDQQWSNIDVSVQHEHEHEYEHEGGSMKCADCVGWCITRRGRTVKIKIKRETRTKSDERHIRAENGKRLRWSKYTRWRMESKARREDKDGQERHRNVTLCLAKGATMRKWWWWGTYITTCACSRRELEERGGAWRFYFSVQERGRREGSEEKGENTVRLRRQCVVEWTARGEERERRRRREWQWQWQLDSSAMETRERVCRAERALEDQGSPSSLKSSSIPQKERARYVFAQPSASFLVFLRLIAR